MVGAKKKQTQICQSGCSQGCNTKIWLLTNRLESLLRRRCSTFCLDFFICLQCQLMLTSEQIFAAFL